MINPKARREIFFKKTPVKTPSKSPVKSQSPINKLNNYFHPAKHLEDHMLRHAIEKDLLKTPSLYYMGNLIGLWDPIPPEKRNEFTLHKNTKINEWFKELLNCMQSLLDFERFYITFGILLPELKDIGSPT